MSALIGNDHIQFVVRTDPQPAASVIGFTEYASHRCARRYIGPGQLRYESTGRVELIHSAAFVVDIDVAARIDSETKRVLEAAFDRGSGWNVLPRNLSDECAGGVPLIDGLLQTTYGSFCGLVENIDVAVRGVDRQRERGDEWTGFRCARGHFTHRNLLNEFTGGIPLVDNPVGIVKEIDIVMCVNRNPTHCFEGNTVHRSAHGNVFSRQPPDEFAFGVELIYASTAVWPRFGDIQVATRVDGNAVQRRFFKRASKRTQSPENFTRRGVLGYSFSCFVYVDFAAGTGRHGIRFAFCRYLVEVAVYEYGLCGSARVCESDAQRD
jgi:hypothetical protein